MRRVIEAAGMMAVAFMAAMFLVVAATEAGADVPEPDGLWTGPMQGETPKTLSGAVVVDLAGVETLLPKEPILLDVGPGAKKPEDFPKDRLWLPTHRSIPGAVWFPGAGAAKLDAAREETFYRRIGELTRGDSSRPIVTFCLPRCWGSWNVGKRLVMKGYTNVHWFPGGIESWRQKHETIEVKPDAAWESKHTQ